MIQHAIYICGFLQGIEKTEFQQFLSIAKASCAEVRSQLYVAFYIGYLDQIIFNQLLSLAEEVGRVLGGLRASIEKKRRAE